MIQVTQANGGTPVYLNPAHIVLVEPKNDTADPDKAGAYVVVAHYYESQPDASGGPCWMAVQERARAVVAEIRESIQRVQVIDLVEVRNG
jgi:uncharacterized protein YlzI (FlbEa/FlbD family)